MYEARYEQGLREGNKEVYVREDKKWGESDCTTTKRGRNFLPGFSAMTTLSRSVGILF